MYGITLSHQLSLKKAQVAAAQVADEGDGMLLKIKVTTHIFY